MATIYSQQRPHHSRPVTLYDPLSYPQYSANIREDSDAEYPTLRHPEPQHQVDQSTLIQQVSTDANHAFHAPDLGGPTATAHHVDSSSQSSDLSMPQGEAADFDMQAPVPSIHASWQALHSYAQSHAAQHGYALSINTTAKNRERIKLACVCYGQPKNTHKLTAETRVRKNRVSYKTGCRMWVEGKKQGDGTWLLKVGEPLHNHPGRPSDEWAVQRKRTWGDIGGRIGQGGVTAKEELRRAGAVGKGGGADGDEEGEGEQGDGDAGAAHEEHTHERGGLAWKIVEQEMMKKNEPNQGRDRGVGRTVEALQAQLPGIKILKRDVYNLRAQIKKARKAAGQEVGDGVDENEHVPAPVVLEAETNDSAGEDDQNEDAKISTQSPKQPQEPSRTGVLAFRIDPQLLPAPQPRPTLPDPPPPSSPPKLTPQEAEILQLRKENAQLKMLLAERTKALKEKTIEVAGLKAQAEYARNMAMLPS